MELAPGPARLVATPDTLYCRADIHGVCRPALQVGGDFYDYFVSAKTIGRPFTFAVGDVSGKGLSAALLMAMTRTNLRGNALRTADCTPETILARANEDLYDDFTEVGMMATVLVGQYDPASGMLSYANAGHSPVILCPAGGPARLLEADGPAMGVLPEFTLVKETIPFPVWRYPGGGNRWLQRGAE